MSDPPLRERFRTLREAEAESAPGFAHTLARARGRRVRTPRIWLWAPALAAGAAGLWMVLALPDSRPAPRPLEPGCWVMPTDVLLELPGAALLRELPDIGAPIEIPASPPRTGSRSEPRRTLG